MWARQAWALGVGRAGHWARRALGAQGAGRAGAGRAWARGRQALACRRARRALGERVLGERVSEAGRAGACGMRLRHGRWGPATPQPEAAIRPGTPATIWRWAGHDTDARAPGRAWCAGWVNWGLMQPVWVLTWAFDSVVFLSRRLDSVHEHCS